MADQELRDRHGKLLGKIKQCGDGKLELRDSHGKLIGVYNPKSNETRNPHGSLIGKGNLLTTQL